MLGARWWLTLVCGRFDQGEPIERCPDGRLGLRDGIWFDGALGTNYALGTEFGGRASTHCDRSLQADRHIPPR